MTEKYMPELGQMGCGQPFKEYPVPDIWGAAFMYLAYELDRVMWNTRQGPYDSPFNNSGNSFKCDAFHVEAYEWDDSREQPYNFKWGDVEVSWYKYLGRGMSANKPLSPDLAADMLKDCIEAVRD